jgi:hypothetical protein
LPGYVVGRPVPVLVGYMGCPAGAAPGYGRGAPGAVRFGWRPGCWGPGVAGGQAIPAASANTDAGPMGIEAVWGGRPAIPTWRPTSNVSSGPSGFPTLTLWPSRMSTTGTRRPLTYVPFSEPLSIASHRPWSNRSKRCAREIRGCVMRMSALRSRPTTTSWPAAKVRSDPSCRTVSAGGAGGVIGPTVARCPIAASAINAAWRGLITRFSRHHQWKGLTPVTAVTGGRPGGFLPGSQRQPARRASSVTPLRGAHRQRSGIPVTTQWVRL